MRFLVAECEPPEAREKRRESVGRSSGETYLEVLHKLAPGAECDRLKPTDSRTEIPSLETLAGYDAVFLTGSPLHLWQDSPEARRQIEFMQKVFASGTPSFGSCAGLQVACVAAGGKVRPMGQRREAGFARRLVATEVGRGHPLLDGRPASYDAPAIHTDEVEALPEGATLLASNRVTQVQAAEIRCGEGIFWGVQYHPEISLREVAAALRRQSEDLLEHGLARSDTDVEQLAQQVDALHEEPDRADLVWRLGLDDQVTVPELRTRELRNFIEHLVKPTRGRRGRV
jgi:GMP synthase (glutamine-hydrolysing)